MSIDTVDPDPASLTDEERAIAEASPVCPWVSCGTRTIALLDLDGKVVGYVCPACNMEYTIA